MLGLWRGAEVGVGDCGEALRWVFGGEETAEGWRKELGGM